MNTSNSVTPTRASALPWILSLVAVVGCIVFGVAWIAERRRTAAAETRFESAMRQQLHYADGLKQEIARNRELNDELQRLRPPTPTPPVIPEPEPPSEKPGQ